MNLMDFYAFRFLHDEKFSFSALERWKEVLQSNTFVEGRYNQSFEEKFSRLQKAGHCLLVGNGTDALEMALVSGKIGSGDKVGIPGITFHATAEAVVNVGAIPVLIDVIAETGLMDPDSLERVLLQHNLAAVVPVHIYGLPVAMEKIERVCLPRKIYIVEDAAQALGAFYADSGKPVGSRQSPAAFSFYPTKNLGAMGDAGCVLIQCARQAAAIRAMRNHGRGGEKVGRNSRCDHLQAAILDLKLASIEKLNLRRKEIAACYHRCLQGLPLETVPERYLPLSSWHLYPVRLGDVQGAVRLREFLQEKGVKTMDFYSKALSQWPWATGWEGEWTKAEFLAGRVVCLPVHPFLADEDIHRVADKIREFFKD